MFQGFTDATSQFLWGLALNNERPWFEAHREEYDKTLRIPFRDLANETTAIMNERFPEKELALHISRIHRDARRLFGRGPYKDHLWFSLKSTNGLLCGPMFWFEIGAADYSYGVGFYSATPQQMEIYRKSVDANPAKLERLAKQLNSQNKFRLEGEEYKRPKGDHGEILNPWYNKKHLSLIYEDNFGGELYDPALPALLADAYTWLMPYYDYFCSFDIPEFRRDEDR